MRLNICFIFTFILATNLASSSVAAIISVTGAATVVAPPTTVVQNTYESNDEIHIFGERSSTTLLDGITIDISEPSTINFLEDFSPSVVGQGSVVSSTYITFDPVGTTTLRTLSGSVTFDQDIVGIIYRTASLTPSHSALGNPNTIYQMTNDIGAYGADYGQDPVTLTPDRRTVVFTFNADGGADSLRVITVAPEPSCMSLIIMQLTLLLYRGHRQRK